MWTAWHILPDSLLSPSGANSAALMRTGCKTYRAAAQYLHALPYGRNSDRSNYRLVLPEARGTCSTKHALLAAVAREQAIPVSLTVGIYDMNEANTPGVGSILGAHGLHSIPEAHCYLTYGEHRIDITRTGVSPATAITHVVHEWSIEPSQIGEHKVHLHQTYLEGWLADHRELSLTSDELW